MGDMADMYDGSDDRWASSVDCDGCSAGEESDFPWATVWPEWKAAGWLARKVDDKWVHLCPDCAENAKVRARVLEGGEA